MTEKIKDFFTDVLVNLIYFDKNFEYEPGVRDDIDTPYSRQKQWWQNYLTSLIFCLFVGVFAVCMSVGASTVDQVTDDRFLNEGAFRKAGVSDPPEGFDDENDKNIIEVELPKGFEAKDILIGQRFFPQTEKDEKAVVVKREVEPAIVVAAVNEPKIYE